MKVFNKNRSLLFSFAIVGIATCFFNGDCFASKNCLLKSLVLNQQPTPAVVEPQQLMTSIGEQQRNGNFTPVIMEEDQIDAIVQRIGDSIRAVMQDNNIANTRQLIQQINMPHMPENVLRREDFLVEVEKRQAVMVQQFRDDLRDVVTALNNMEARLVALENVNNRVRVRANTEDNGHNFGLLVGGIVVAGTSFAAGYFLNRLLRRR